MSSTGGSLPSGFWDIHFYTSTSYLFSSFPVLAHQDDFDPAKLHLDPELLRDFVILSMSAALGGVAAAGFGLPEILGYILGGMLVGPGGADVIREVGYALDGYSGDVWWQRDSKLSCVSQAKGLSDVVAELGSAVQACYGQDRRRQSEAFRRMHNTLERAH